MIPFSEPLSTLSPTEPVRVVVADDSSVIRDHLVEFLRGLRAHLAVFEAETGREAIEAVQRHRPQLLVLDLSMPDGNGMAVLKALHELPVPRPLTMVLTNFADADTREAVLAAGAHYFFDKSGEFEAMLDEVERLFDPSDPGRPLSAPAR